MTTGWFADLLIDRTIISLLIGRLITGGLIDLLTDRIIISLVVWLPTGWLADLLHTEIY